MLIVGLIGSLASGKTLLANIFHQRYEFVVLKFADFHADGDETAAKKCLAKAGETVPKSVVVIGIDSFESLDEFRDNPQFFGIAVEGPVTLRYRRGKYSSVHSFEEFVQRDDSIQFGASPLVRCLDMCDFRLLNDTSDRKDLEEKVDRLFASSKTNDDLTTTKLLCSDWDEYFLMLAWITAAQ